MAGIETETEIDDETQAIHAVLYLVFLFSCINFFPPPGFLLCRSCFFFPLPHFLSALKRLPSQFSQHFSHSSHAHTPTARRCMCAPNSSSYSTALFSLPTLYCCARALLCPCNFCALCSELALSRFYFSHKPAWSGGSKKTLA